MSWQKIVTYTPQEYRKEMKKRGIAMIIFVIIFITFIMGFSYWISNSMKINNSAYWGYKGFLYKGNNVVSVFGTACNQSGLYLGVKMDSGENISSINIIPVSNITSSYGDGFSFSPNSFGVWRFPSLTCPYYNQNYSANVQISYEIDGQHQNLNGSIWGVTSACIFTNRSLSCT